jgi:GNAT superfamily N-acetyltransferase
MESYSGPAWTIRTRSGTIGVDPATVSAAVVVPDRPARLRTARDVDAASLELIAAQGWQGLEQSRLGDWLLRAAGGFTGRANSVLPLGDPGVPLHEALAAVTAWYRERGLPVQFQLPLPLCTDLDDALADLGWPESPAVDVMVTDLTPLQMAAGSAPDIAVDVSTVPDAAWLAAFRYADQPLPASLTEVVTKAEHPVFVSARDETGSTVALARGALTPQWLGITAVEVVAHRRRQGLGGRVIAALADYAALHHTRHVYLQVAQENEPAQRLYASLGFVHHHRYVYRRPAEQS